MVASFQIRLRLSTVKCHHHSPSFEWDDFSRVVQSRLFGYPGIGVVLGVSTVCGRRRESSFLRLFLPPVLFSAREHGHLPPSSVLSKDNTGTGNGALGGRLTRTVLYDFRLKNPACRTPGATLTMDW